MAAITVGEFREFLSDSSSSMVDAGAGRIIDRVIGSTMRRLSREGRWEFKRRRILLFMEARKQADFATVANGSTTVALDLAQPGAFPMEQRFFTEKWNVQLSGRETVYQFDGNPQPATFEITSAYGGEDTEVGQFDRLNMTRSRYLLEVRFENVYGVELPEEGVNALSYLSRSDFEIYRRGLLTSASQPWVFTTYGNEEIEFWPPAAQDRGFDVEIDLQESVRVPALGAEDTDELDWPRHMEDMLWAIGRLQLVIELGADAVQFDPQAVAGDYGRMLAAYKSRDSQRGKRAWVMGADAIRTGGTPRPFGLNLRGPVRPGP